MSKVKNVTSIRVEGLLNVTGVYNYNRGVGNTSYAKKDSAGVDYTSGGCLRQLFYAEEIPSQPNKKELEDQVATLAGSIAGYTRGLLEVTSGSKKDSCLSIMDAYTTKDSNQTAITEVRVSTKEKETGLKSNSKHNKGGDAKDVSLFAKENIGPRKQSFKMAISIDKLQRAVTRGQSAIVPDAKVDEFLASLSGSLSSLGVDGKIAEVAHKPANAVFATTQTGIILSQEQQAAVIKYLMNKATLLSGTKREASIEIDPSTLTVSLMTKGSLAPAASMSVNEFMSKLEKGDVEFASFYKEVSDETKKETSSKKKAKAS